MWDSSKTSQNILQEHAVTDHVKNMLKISSFRCPTKITVLGNRDSIRGGDEPQVNRRNQNRHQTEKKTKAKLVRTRWPNGENLI